MATYKIFAAYKSNGRLTNTSDYVEANNRQEAEAKYRKEYKNLKGLKIVNVWKETKQGWTALR